MSTIASWSALTVGQCAFSALLVGALATGAIARTPSAGSLNGGEPSERISVNDNRKPAGRLENGVLTLRLEARNGVWYPDGPEGTAYPVAAFAEDGGPLQNPGPLVRVPVGTAVRVIVRNALAEPLTMFGFGETRGVVGDTFEIAPGATREMRFEAVEAGTFYYLGRTDRTRSRPFGRRGLDSQLNGVIVVDPAAGPPREDRIFLVSWFINDADSLGRPLPGPRTTVVINGLSWPHTERFHATQGDSLYWRWVSVTAAQHPLHLHGFYFRVDSKGDGARDTLYSTEQRRLAVTEVLRPGQTMEIAWSPVRPGNWIFHCHLSNHITPGAGTGEESSAAEHAEHGGGDRVHAMSRMVLGVHVEPRGDQPAVSRHARPIRLLIRSRPGVYGDRPGYAYVLGGSAEENDPNALRIPGPTLVLEKDEPVAITLVNRTHEPAAVHWHGIELDSYPDGVPGFSGAGQNLLAAIPVGDSLTVRFTPPRAGTFMYHSHFNERQQISSGLYGAIVVLERGQRLDPATDRLVILSDPEPAGDRAGAPATNALLNGQASHQPIVFRAGQTHRLRIVNIRSNALTAIELREGDRVAEWRHVAKDGADLPPAQATLRPAFLVLGVGEIYDVEFTPRSPGEMTLRYGFLPILRPAPVPVPNARPLPPPVLVGVVVR